MVRAVNIGQCRELGGIFALVFGGLIAGPAHSASLTRTSYYEYNADGLLAQETLNPADPNQCLQTRYGYDQWGNRTSTSTSACAGASATTLSSANTERSSTDTYRSDGRFVEISTNALGQDEKKVWDARFGFLKSLDGPNRLVTSWESDNFGRKIKETRSDGTSTTWQYQLCTEATANCPSSIGSISPIWVLSQQDFGAVNTSVPTGPLQRQYFDALERPIRSQTQGFDGAGAAATLVQDTTYNNQGLVERQSQWYALGVDTPVWTNYHYDALGRITKEERPDPNATGGIATTTTTYQGLSTTVTNPLGQTKTTLKNAQGQVVQITDAQGSVLRYSYDPVGNLTQTDAAGSITKMGYDLRGRKTSMEDPAMGRWKYDYNAFGELVGQTDSLGKVATIAYDQLGRMTQRVEGELTSWWSFETNFDATSCGKAVGKLCQAKTDNGYLRSHAYDDKGRMDYTATLLDNSQAVVRSQYDDNTGRVKGKTWVNTGYQVNYGYTPLGYLWSVSASGAGVPKPVSYEIQQMNAAGQILRYKTGNQVIVVNGVDERTQRLMSISAAVEGQAAGSVLSHNYSYDAIGNLLTRADTSPGVATSEAFGYDSLNRIKSATLIGGAVSPPQTVEVLYDARGNITYKSDVGRYWYDGARPNRMTQVTLETAPGANVPLSGTRALSYAFDDYRPGAQSVNGTTVGNGNLEYTVTHDSATNRHFVRAESYTSFNMPAQITYSNFSADTSTCPQGYTLSNGVCTQTVNTATAATPVYSCPAGQTLSSTHCIQTTVVAATPNFTCPAGYSLVEVGCTKVTTVSATPIMGCPSGYTWMWVPEEFSSSYACAYTYNSHGDTNYVTTGSIGTGNYSCPAGYTLAGAMCSQTTTVAPVAALYSCPAGWTLTGSNCSITSSSSALPVAASPDYVCASGTTLSGTQCLSTVSAAGTPVMGCPAGYTWDYEMGCGRIVSYGAGSSPNYAWVGQIVVGYNCPAGYVLAGSACSKTLSSSASIASYSCPSGRNLVGTSCVLPGATLVGYSCTAGTLSGNQCLFTQTLQTPPGSSNAADRSLSFVYGPEHQRVKQNVTLTGNGTSSYFAGNTWYANGEDSLGLSYEKEVRANGTTEHKHYVAAAGFVFAIVTTREGNLNGLAANSTSYLIKDHLGSIAAITNEAGTVTERLAYDPWGKRRYINSLPGQSDKLDALVGQGTERGYTEHEHLDEIGVIHMNGRIYDPLMGRFMSADPNMFHPQNMKDFNRYAYVWNNPLKMFDPTGYMVGPSEYSSWSSPSETFHSWYTRVFSESESKDSSVHVDNDSTGRSWGNGGTVQVAVAPAAVALGAVAGYAILSGAGIGVSDSDVGGVGWSTAAGDPTGKPRTAAERLERDIRAGGRGFGAVWSAGKDKVLNALGVNAVKSDGEEQSGQNGADSSESPSNELSKNHQDKIKGAEAALAEHEKKLADYKEDPDKYDNNGFFKDAPPDRRQSIIDGRIRTLENTIKNVRNVLDQLRKK